MQHAEKMRPFAAMCVRPITSLLVVFENRPARHLVLTSADVTNILHDAEVLSRKQVAIAF